MAANRVVPRVAVVGGGITGTLASLVLKNRGASPLLIDAGKGGVGGRLRGSRGLEGSNAGVQFIRAADPRLGGLLANLEGAGFLKRWTGRFGLLGSKGGGFLPSEIVGSAGVRGMGRVDPVGGTVSDVGSADGDDAQGDNSSDSSSSSPTDTGDFCGFVEKHRRDVPTFVGNPSMTDLSPNICKHAGIDVLSDSTVVKAGMVEGGGWRLDVKGNNDGGDGGAAAAAAAECNETVFDALVLTTHDPSLASETVRSIAAAEALAAGSVGSGGAAASTEGGTTVEGRLLRLADDLRSIRETGRMPIFTWSGRFPASLSASVPFDAVSVPGSHSVQFLVRENSKLGAEDVGGDDDEEVWTAVSTSAFAADFLDRLGPTREASDEASLLLANEVSKLLSPYHASSPSTESITHPTHSRAVRWGAGFTSSTLGLSEDSVALAPWRLAIGGEFVRERSAHETPFEAAALSGLEAGERAAAFFREEQ